MKILITIKGNNIAARFDLTTEVLIAETDQAGIRGEPRIILLPRASGEELCGLIVKEDIATVICGGIEDVHYQYLVWKKIRVVDGVIGPYATALQRLMENRLQAGDMVPETA